MSHFSLCSATGRSQRRGLRRRCPSTPRAVVVSFARILPIAERVTHSDTSSSAQGRRPSDDEFFTTAELAALLKIPPKTLSWWRHKRKGPLFHRDGRYVRYPKTLVDAWLATRTEEAEQWMES